MSTTLAHSKNGTPCVARLCNPPPNKRLLQPSTRRTEPASSTRPPMAKRLKQDVPPAPRATTATVTTVIFLPTAQQRLVLTVTSATSPSVVCIQWSRTTNTTNRDCNQMHSVLPPAPTTPSPLPLPSTTRLSSLLPPLPPPSSQHRPLPQHLLPPTTRRSSRVPGPAGVAGQAPVGPYYLLPPRRWQDEDIDVMADDGAALARYLARRDQEDQR